MFIKCVCRLKQYENRVKGLAGLDANLTGQLTEAETKLVESQEVIEIRGKVCISDAEVTENMDTKSCVPLE